MPSEETEKKADSARSQVLGSIIGQRSPSGKTVSALKMSGSFEAPERVSNFAVDPSARIRANTDPPKLMRESLQEQTIMEEDHQDDEISPAILRSDSEDEELLMAKAMALAIENNRGKSIEEIRQLVGAVQQQSSHSKTAHSAAPGLVAAGAAAAPTLLIPQRFTNIFSATLTEANATVTTTTATSNNLDASKKSSAKVSIRTFGERARGRFNDMLGSQTLASGGPIAKLVTSAGNGLEDSSSHTADSVGGIQPASAPSSTTSVSSKDHGRRIPFRHSMKPSPRTPPISPTPTDTPLTTVIGNAETLPQDISESSVAATANTAASSDTRQASTLTSHTTLTTIIKPIPIRLSGVAWKRRGGMGKYSTAAWEKRRIELQGSKMFYYRDTDVIPPDEEVSDGVGALSPKDTSLNADPDDEAVVVTRRTTWFEQATASLVSAVEDPTAPRGYLDLAKEKATVHAAFGHSGAPSPFAISIKVRGETRWKLCFDYHKTQMEWLVAITDVVVQASVDAYNAALLEAADPANQTEVVAAAAALFPPTALSEPPAPDEEGATAGSHRLWMLDQYTVSNCTDLKNQATSNSDLETEEDNSNVKVDREIADFEDRDRLQVTDDDEMLDHEAIRADALEKSSKTWTIPEKNLWYLGAILNFGLAYARASSTTMDGFWYLVALVNVGAYLCLSREVDWRSLLLHVKAVPGVSSRISIVPTKKQKSTGEPNKLSSPTAGTKKSNGYIPTAGSSSVKLKDPLDAPQNEKGEMFAGWRTQPGEILQVRSHGYSVTKKKVASPGELYDCVAVDIFESPSRYPDMAKRVKLPKVEYTDDGVKTWRSPDIFIISIALPTDPPKMGRTSSDGGGYTVTMYFAMKQETRDILRRVTADGYVSTQDNAGDPQKNKINAVRLLEEWCRRAPTDQKYFSRFKIVPHAHNLKEIGMPNWISRYNGKPFLIKRPGQTGFLYSHPELSCVEFDVSLHPFPYLARQAICFMKDSYFKRVLVTFGFVIEGRSDDELPECLIGAMQLCYPDPAYAIQAEDFFAGTAPRSV